MHVAICDDNVADRKHLERLLSRESDKRAGTTNILYIDSYGDKDYVLKNQTPLKYNIIFMDMCARAGIVEEIIQALEEMGYHAPLILYSSKYDYTAIPHLPEYVVHCKKPCIPDPLPDFLSLGDANVVGNIVTLQVHRRKELLHIPKNDVMYALSNGKQYSFYLTDGSVLAVDEDYNDLRLMFEPLDEFEHVNKNCIANFKFVSAVNPLSVVMNDKKQFRISPFNYHALKWLKDGMGQIE